MFMLISSLYIVNCKSVWCRPSGFCDVLSVLLRHQLIQLEGIFPKEMIDDPDTPGHPFCYYCAGRVIFADVEGHNEGLI